MLTPVTPHRYTFFTISICCLAVSLGLSGCSTGQPMVVEKLDSGTAVTITHSRTPLIMSPDVHYSDPAAREYVQIGAIEINRMGKLRYYLWLGIWDIEHANRDDVYPRGFESVEILADGERLTFNVLGWSHDAIGTSERAYKKIFSEDVDAYYGATLAQIQAIVDASELKLQTGEPQNKEFIPWYNQEKANIDLAEFLRTVRL